MSSCLAITFTSSDRLPSGAGVSPAGGACASVGIGASCAMAAPLPNDVNAKEKITSTRRVSAQTGLGIGSLFLDLGTPQRRRGGRSVMQGRLQARGGARDRKRR